MTTLFTPRLLVGLAMALVAAASARPACAIVGGELDGDRHPNVGTFVWPDGIDLDGDDVPDDFDEDGVPDVPAVGGNFTLIHPRVGVLVGHVTELFLEELANGFYTLDDMKVSFSPNPAADDPDTWLDVADLITHPDFDPRVQFGLGATPLADIGVVVLEDPVLHLTPAPVAPEGFLDFLEAAGELREGPDGTKFTVVGYGIHGDAPNQLLGFDGQRRVAQSEFLLLLDRWLILDQNPAHGNGGTAVFDSGGPTFWVHPVTGQEILVSLTSRGDAALVSTGVTYRVDTAEAFDFLDLMVEMVEAGEL